MYYQHQPPVALLGELPRDGRPDACAPPGHHRHPLPHRAPRAAVDPAGGRGGGAAQAGGERQRRKRRGGAEMFLLRIYNAVAIR